MKAILFLMALIAATAHAEDINPYQALLAATTACESPNNPLEDGVKALGGNSMSITSFQKQEDGDLDFTIFVGDILNNYLTVSHGRLTLHAGYEKGVMSGKFVCKITLYPAPTAPPVIK